MSIGRPSILGDAPLRNREPAAAGTFTSVIDETLHIAAGSALDMSGWRQTAVPAGGRGRITVSSDKLHEAGVPVRFFIATIQPEVAFTPIPSDPATVDAAARFLARQGFNAVRLMGLEHWVKHGVRGVSNFNPARIEALDYFMAACKREGLFWVVTTQSYNAFEDIPDPTQPFQYTEATSTKPRMFTEGDVRARWKEGFGALYNRVNKFTGLNMLKDPAMLMVEPYNEQSPTFCGGAQFPSRWLARTPGAAPAALTWPEWLADPTQAHGCANLAAINAQWGTAFGSLAAAAADPLPALVNSMPLTQKNLDMIQYVQYLSDHMAAFYAACFEEWGFNGIVCWHTMYAANVEAREIAKLGAVNHIANWHAYLNISYGGLSLLPTTDADNPIWENERVVLASPASSGNKPVWMGEMGVHTYARWGRHQFAIVLASLAAQGVSASSWFAQGDFFVPNYFNDQTLHGDRLRRLDSFCAPGAHANDFMRVLQCALILRGDVSELPVNQPLILNDRHTGINPRNPSRISRVYSTLGQPLQFICAAVKARLNWVADNTDDSLAATWGTMDLKALMQAMQAAGAVAADHPTLVSAVANSGTIASVATTGTVGGLAASQAEPVVDIGSNSLVDGDLIHVTSLNGSSGTWPGTNNRAQRAAVLKGTGTFVQLRADPTRNVSGLPLTGLSGANFVSGTWCEGANVLESGHRQWGMSRRLRRCFINTDRTVFFSHTNASLPASVGPMTVQSLSQNASVFLTSLDGSPLASCTRLLIGVCGEAINTGMTYSVGADGKQTLTATGNYPVQQLDITAVLSLGLALPQSWRVYRLQRDGQRNSRETPTEIDADAGRLIVTLRTGVVRPSVLWELVR